MRYLGSFPRGVLARCPCLLVFIPPPPCAAVVWDGVSPCVGTEGARPAAEVTGRPWLRSAPLLVPGRLSMKLAVRAPIIPPWRGGDRVGGEDGWVERMGGLRGWVG